LREKRGHCKKIYEIPGFVLTKLGLGKLFPARESLISDIPAGDRNTAKPFSLQWIESFDRDLRREAKVFFTPPCCIYNANKG